MNRIKRNIVAALIFSKDGKIFQGKKHPEGGGVYIERWLLPGGGVEEGETETEAVIREIKEEAGIDLTPYELERIDDSGTGESEKTLPTGERVIAEMTFIIYKAVITDKNADEIVISLDDDLDTYRWIDPKDLKREELPLPAVELFEKLGYL